MTEKEYRLQRLKQNKKISSQKIVLYGTGKNAAYILDNCPEWNIIGLMDGKRTSGYYKGKKILSDREVALAAPELIVMAAEHQAAAAIYQRIAIFCRQHHIALFNMYGEDELALQQLLLEQERQYLYCSADTLRKEIDRHEGVCFELFGTLCEISAWPACDRAAESVGSEAAKEAGSRAVPRRTMIEACNYAIHNKKQVSVYMERKMLYADRGFKADEDINAGLDWEDIMTKLGITGKITILEEGLGENQRFSEGLLRDEALGFSRTKWLYVGTNRNNNLLMPFNYGQDIFLIKSCQEIFHQLTLYNLYADHQDRDKNQTAMNDFVIDAFNDPFCFQGTEGMNPVALNREVPLVGGKLEFTEYEHPQVTIIIPVHNQFNYTWYCLRSVLRSVKDVAYEVILADDCSTDRIKDIERLTANVKVIHNNSRKHFLQNCNHAASLAKGKYLVFLNNDTLVYPDWLSPMLALLEQDESIGMTGSKLIYPDGRLQEAGGTVFRDGGAKNNGHGDCPDGPEYNHVRPVDYISGASMMISKELWDKIGGFDERYCPAYYEDTDLAFAVRAQGKSVVYQPESAVIHFGGVSHGIDLTQGIKSYQVINQQKFYEKWQQELAARTQ